MGSRNTYAHKLNCGDYNVHAIHHTTVNHSSKSKKQAGVTALPLRTKEQSRHKQRPKLHKPNSCLIICIVVGCSKHNGNCHMLEAMLNEIATPFHSVIDEELCHDDRSE